MARDCGRVSDRVNGYARPHDYAVRPHDYAVETRHDDDARLLHRRLDVG